LIVRLDVALIGLHPGLSRRKAREAIEKGQVELEGAVVLEPGLGVTEQSKIHWDRNRKALRRARCSLRLLYQDDAVVIVDKPAGLLSVPTASDATDEDTALLRVEDFARRLHPKSPYAGAVHRIDRWTSGALAFALNAAAREGLRTLFREHRIDRVYHALVAGDPKSPTGVIDRPIHDSFEGGRRRVARPGEESHPARTRYHVREHFGGAALLEVELETGRQHQIRLHLASIGLPILGDGVYGVSWPGVERPMLHARVLGFVHPLTGEKVRVESPIPEDFEKVAAALRRAPPRKAPAGGPGVPAEVHRKGHRPGRKAPAAGTSSPSPEPRRRGSSSRPGGGARKGQRSRPRR
jgi:23S rRNA pseudouridine1911/1915/1917 synthase